MSPIFLFTIRDVPWLTAIAAVACLVVLALPDSDNVILLSMDSGGKLFAAVAIFAFGAGCYVAGRLTRPATLNQA
jgi:hypothetical protein